MPYGKERSVLKAFSEELIGSGTAFQLLLSSPSDVEQSLSVFMDGLHLFPQFASKIPFGAELVPLLMGE